MKTKGSPSLRHPSRAMRIAGLATALVAVGAIATVAQGMDAGTGTAAGTGVSSPSATATAAEPVPAPAASGSAPIASAAAPVPQATPPTAPPAGAGVPASAIDNANVAPPVKDAVAGFINKGSQIATGKPAAPAPGDTAPIPAPDDFAAIAHGSALGELEAKNQEFAVNGWQQSGTVQVVGAADATTVDKDGAATVSITVCLDSSAVSLTDATGATVLAAEQAGTRKNLNTYAVQEVAGVWLVVEHTFPGDSSC